LKIARFMLAASAAMAFLLAANVLLYPIVFPAESPQYYTYERAEPLAAYRLLAMIVTAGLLAYVFPIGYRGKTPWAEGLRFGMLMGALVSLPASLGVYAKADVAFAGLLTTILWTVITMGIAGGLIGAVYGDTLKRN